MIRNQIIDYFNQPLLFRGEYKRMKLLLGIGDEIDPWFEGVIKSLKYQPNTKVFVLVGKSGIGKSSFFRNLLPNPDWFVEHPANSFFYDYLLCDFDFNHGNLNISMNHEFYCTSIDTAIGYVDVNKRLCSYCCSTNYWNIPQRKNYIFIRWPDNKGIIDISSIDTTQMWRELYHLYK